MAHLPTNHVGTLSSIDFFTVPTAIFRVLYVFLVLAHDRRRVLYFNVTEHPTALDRPADRRGMGIEEVLSAPRSPWQNAFVERLSGSVRRECLDHIVVLGERHLRRLLASYFDYYHRSRTHLSLNEDAPAYRPVMSPEIGEVVGLPEVGGLHHRHHRLPT